MKFLSKIHAIHPRGQRAKTGVKKQKAGFSLPKGKSLKHKLDWIAISVMDLIDDFNFTPKTNKLINEVRSLHSFITDSMGSENQLLAYTKLANLASKVGKDFQRLYAKGSLPEGVDRQMIHTLLDVVGEIEKRKTDLDEAKKLLDAAKSEMDRLGF